MREKKKQKTSLSQEQKKENVKYRIIVYDSRGVGAGLSNE